MRTSIASGPRLRREAAATTRSKTTSGGGRVPAPVFVVPEGLYEAVAGFQRKPGVRGGRWATAGPERGHSRITMLCRKVAHNFPRSFFEYPSKRCNSNDTNSRHEEAGGELRAKFVSVLGKRQRVEGPVHASSRQHRRPISDERCCDWLSLKPGRHAPVGEHCTS